jgi:phosphoglycolate phosphatase
VEARLVVFDLDGTLVDSRRDLADAANALIVEHGGAPLPVEDVAGMVGEGAALLVRRALTAAGIVAPDLDSALSRFLELYDERLIVHTRLYEGTSDALSALAARVPLAVLTNKPQHHTEKLLTGLGLAGRFRWVIGGDTAHGRKPDPSGLNSLIRAADASAAATMMVGDSVIDLRTARAAGTPVCLVKYGFGFASAAGELSGTELLATRPADLARLF